MTRDEKLAEQIGTSQEVLGVLKREVGAIVEHALSQDAPAHAGLYQAVYEDLHEAWKLVGDAYEVMSYGDPEDYA